MKITDFFMFNKSFVVVNEIAEHGELDALIESEKF